MTWINCALFLLCGFLYSNALLFHGSQTNATLSTSSGQPDSNDHQRLLHLETVLDLVIKELNSVNQENQLLQLKQTTLEREVQAIKQWNQTMEMKLQAAETKITFLEDSLKAVISENKVLKDRVDILNSSSTSTQLQDSFQKQLDSLNLTSSSLQQENINLKKEVNILNSSYLELKQNISTTEDARRLENIQLDILNSTSIFLLQQNINLQKQVNILNSSLTLTQQNMSTSEDIRRLENILKFEVKQTVSDREQEMMKNISTTVTDLELRDRYLSLSLLDVHSNMTMLNITLSKLEQQQKRQEEQQNKTIEQLTHSLQNNTVKLSNILSSLRTRVAFTAGVHYYDKHNIAPSEKIIFPQVMYEVGGGYNPTTGVFTAPKAGLYLIFNTVVAQSHELIRTQIRINGSLKASIMAYVTSSTALLHLLRLSTNLPLTLWFNSYKWEIEFGYESIRELIFTLIMKRQPFLSP